VLRRLRPTHLLQLRIRLLTNNHDENSQIKNNQQRLKQKEQTAVYTYDQIRENERNFQPNPTQMKITIEISDSKSCFMYNIEFGNVSYTAHGSVFTHPENPNFIFP
jgi:hypothetical protein